MGVMPKCCLVSFRGFKKITKAKLDKKDDKRNPKKSASQGYKKIIKPI